MIITIRNPDTLEIVQTLDDHDYASPASRGGQPINEACGGCVGCLEIQACHYGYLIEYDGEPAEKFFDAKLMDYYLDHWLEYVLIRTQIPEILKAQHDDIGLTKAVQPAYFLYGIEKNDNGLAAARYAVHLGDELKLVSKKEADPNFVRWATLVDLQKWHEAWKQQLLKYQGTGNTPLPIGVYDENNNS